MSYESNTPEVIAQLKRANAAGVLAAGIVYESAVEQALEGGFTSGDFETGESVRGVKHTEPQATADGVAVRVGTDVLHNLFWELGAYSAFTRRFERKEVWYPTFVSTREQQQAAFIAAHREVMK